MKASTRFLGILAVALGAATPAFADRDSKDVRDSREPLGELSAQWWQWAISIPAKVNPLTDAGALGGQYCMVGQRGDIWFLAGSTTELETRRSCTVPEGMPLFFPVINTVWINTPACDGEAFNVTQLRAKAAADIDGAKGLSVLLDNRPIKNVQRVRSDVFATAFPDDNIFGSPTCLKRDQLYSPAVDDGYYVKLPGLSHGVHTLSIRGINTGGFAVDVFYTLNIVKVSTRERD